VVTLGPSPESKLLADTLVLVSILGTFMAGQSTYLPASVLFTVATGLVNGLFIGVGHNFLHQAEAFRHHYLDLSGFNSADFRAHHAVSHHPYTNTVADVELNFALPAVNFFPEEAGRRPLRQRVGQRVALALRNGLGTPVLQIGRLAKTLTGRLAGGAGGSRPADKVAALIPAAQIAALAGLQGSLAAGCWRWILMLTSTSNLFLWMNYLTGPHFNDQCWHQGDTLDDRDWGIVQVQTNTERAGLPQDGSLRSNLLNIPTFGLHHLHHLFPTVDAYELSRIMPLFEETCREFGVEFSLMDNYELSNGLWRLLDGVRPSTRTRNGLRMKARL
jgi:fatty acid desaturase